MYFTGDMSLYDRLEEHALKTVIMSIIINYISECNYVLLLLTCTVVDLVWIVTFLFAVLGPWYQQYSRGGVLYDRENLSCKYFHLVNLSFQTSFWSLSFCLLLLLPSVVSRVCIRCFFILFMNR